MTTRHRAKIDRKARESRRKQRKDSKSSTGVSKRRKDPGVPAMLPMREQMIEKMREERAKEIAQKAARKAMHAEMETEETEPVSEAERLYRLATTAQTASDSFAVQPEESGIKFSDATFNIDSSRRAFYREFKEVFETADVLLMVLDARDPQGCRVREVEEQVLATGGKKRLVMVLNKIDLVPRDNVQGWIKVIQREFPCVAFKSNTQEGRTHLSSSAGSVSGSEAFGADGLLQLLKNYARSGNLSKKLRVRVGVIGYPNVGKSSLINSLKRSRVCNVGATPGVTTARQEIHLDSTVSLIDCPGIVFDHQEQGNSLRNCLKVEQLNDPVTPALEALARIEPTVLQRLYSLPATEETSSSALLTSIAKRLGKLKRGGVPDLDAAARHILNDWNQGRIAYYTPVPTEKPHLLTEAQVVTEFAPRFALEDSEKFANEMMDYETTSTNSAPVNAQIKSNEHPTPSPSPSHSSQDDEEEEEDLVDSNNYDSEDEVNHQINRQSAKNFKKAQKKSAKNARRSMQE